MPTLKVSIKNAGKVYDIELEANATGLDFKQKIQELTNIPPNRQKILVKGGKVNDTDSVSAIVSTAKQPIMVLGTPDKNLPTKPVEKQVFLEDLNQNQLNSVSNDPSGLVNLGNTCYLNSSLQTLFKIEDVNKKVSSYQTGGSSGVSPANALVVGLKSLVGQMSKRQEKVNPTLFLALFRNQFPQFAERDNHGFYKQQDAEEAFSQILRVLCDELKIEDSFRLTFNTDTKCLALPEEEHVFGVEESLKLNCHIDIRTNFLRDGLLAGLKDTMEKYNDTLQSNAEYEVSKKITRLPKYLTVHFVRFFWRRDTQKKSKILRRVQFPFDLDLSEMLDDSIKPGKVNIRDELRKIEKDSLDLIRDFKKAKKDTTLNPIEQQEEDDMKLLSIKSKFSDSFKSILPEDFNVEETAENPSSVYELSAVITHAGSSADSGHYQSFIKDDSDLDGQRWWKFNDDKVSSVNKERIESLAGGGESDSALILIYKGLGL